MLKSGSRGSGSRVADSDTKTGNIPAVTCKYRLFNRKIDEITDGVQ